MDQLISMHIHGKIEKKIIRESTLNSNVVPYNNIMMEDLIWIQENKKKQYQTYAKILILIIRLN